VKQIPNLREVPELPDEVVQAGLNGNLVLFVGAGVSVLVGLPSWKELAYGALQRLRVRGVLDFSELDQLMALDPRKQLSIAEMIAGRSELGNDLMTFFKESVEGDSIYKVINDMGCVCVTTNYDELLSPRFREVDDKVPDATSVKPQPVRRIHTKNDFLAKCLNEPGTVVHLHGAISAPEEMVVTTRQYLEHYDDQNVQHFLGELFARKTVLFIGYGLEEAEILEHILRRGSARATHDRRRFTLQGYFRSQDPLYRRLHEYYDSSFGVNVLGFIRDYHDYNQQKDILKAWATQIKVRRPPLDEDMDFLNKVLGNG
jgi:hypothetical protein